MGRIRQVKQGDISLLAWVQQDNDTAYVVFDGTNFNLTDPVAVDGSLKFKRNVVTVDTDAAVTLSTSNRGTLYVLAKADGITFTLPPAEAGLTYEFFVSVSCTSNNYGIDTDGTDNFEGVVLNVDKDQAYSSLTMLQAIGIANGSPTHIDMDGSTTGGLIGSRIVVTAINADRWMVEGILHGDTNVVTPFS